jgi:hypothetical protein
MDGQERTPCCDLVSVRSSVLKPTPGSIRIVPMFPQANARAAIPCLFEPAWTRLALAVLWTRALPLMHADECVLPGRGPTSAPVRRTRYASRLMNAANTPKPAARSAQVADGEDNPPAGHEGRTPAPDDALMELAAGDDPHLAWSPSGRSATSPTPSRPTRSAEPAKSL